MRGTFGGLRLCGLTGTDFPEPEYCDDGFREWEEEITGVVSSTCSLSVLLSIAWDCYRALAEHTIYGYLKEKPATALGPSGGWSTRNKCAIAHSDFGCHLACQQTKQSACQGCALIRVQVLVQPFPRLPPSNSCHVPICGITHSRERSRNSLFHS
jgi:hypothetical protein